MRTTFIPLLAAAALLTGCDKDHLLDCFKSTGHDVTVTRSIGPFTAIHLHDKVDLEVHFGYRPELQVRGGANLVDGIETDADDGTLTVVNANRCNWMRDFNRRITVVVFCDSLVQMAHYGSGEIRFADTLHCADFQYDHWNATGDVHFLFSIHRFACNIHTGTSSIAASGRSDVNLIYNNAYGDVRLDLLGNDITYVTNSGSGDVFLNVNRELYANIREAGNIYYRGDPVKIETSITGSGQLIKQ